MIGCGKLGMPCAEAMAKKYDVVGYDVAPQQSELVKMVGSLKEAVFGRDLIFVAVPTPHKKEYGGAVPIDNLDPVDFDYTIVKSVLAEINKHATKKQLVILISTVLPGTTRRELAPLITNARFIYNPYLIAMGSVAWDMINPECIIIGTEDGSLTGDAKLLSDFYEPLMENNPRVNIGTWDEAEATKIFYNTFISAKIGLVNMIQDVAEKSGNINVDVVTTALQHATHRITGPKYMVAGIGDSGPCHPRDNIALRWLAKELNLGYDLFHAIMSSRDAQAKAIATRLSELQKVYNMKIVIHGRAYKPQVSYTDGSYSELIGYFLNEMKAPFEYVDPLTNDIRTSESPAIFLMAHNSSVTYAGTGINTADSLYCEIPVGSVVLDPWRTCPKMDGVTVIHYGNTRGKTPHKLKGCPVEEEMKNKIINLRKNDPFIYR